MSAFREEQMVAGVGWVATITSEGAELHVDPEGDHLPEAVDTLVAPSRRRYVTVAWTHEDSRGWDVYQLAFAVQTTPAVHLALV